MHLGCEDSCGAGDLRAVRFLGEASLGVVVVCLVALAAIGAFLVLR